MFSEKYSGYEIKRFHRGDRCTKAELDLYLIPFKTVLIPPLSSIFSKPPIFECKRLFISKYDTIRDVKLWIADLAKFLFNIDISTQLQRIRIWQHNTPNFADWMTDRYEETKGQPDSVEFPGRCLDMYHEFQVKDIYFFNDLEKNELTIEFLDSQGVGIFKHQPAKFLLEMGK